MPLSFSFIGNRPNPADEIAATLDRGLHLEPRQDGTLAVGVGFFQGDEVLLKRRPNETQPAYHLKVDLRDVRAHSLLAHVCDTKEGVLRTETTPPMRYGHLLFSCHGVAQHLSTLRPSVRDALPEFLRSQLKGDTFTELAFGMFLSELPSVELEKAMAKSNPDGAERLRLESTRRALSRTLERLDGFAHAQGIAPFEGSLWMTTSETIQIAHRKGPLGLREFFSQRELGLPEEGARNEVPFHFTAFWAGEGLIPSSWERLPDQTFVTARRTGRPETEALTSAS